MRRKALGVLALTLLGVVAYATEGWAQWARELEGISRLYIAVQELDPLAREVALTKQDLERFVSAVLRGKLPDVTQEMSSEYVLVAVRFSKVDGVARPRGQVAASITLRVYRPVVTLYKLRTLARKPGLDVPNLVMNAVLGAVWQRDALLTGDERAMAGRVTTTLETLLREFVADYYRANPTPPPTPESQ